MRVFLAVVLVLLAAPTWAQRDLPRLVTRDGRHFLLVDGEPLPMLGALADNSSNYPAMLPQVRAMLARLRANTQAISVAWKQVEPAEGRFVFSYLEALVDGARTNDLRAVLLWFATWKNTGPSYARVGVRTNTRRFAHMQTPEGTAHCVLSPHHRFTLEADKRASGGSCAGCATTIPTMRSSWSSRRTRSAAMASSATSQKTGRTASSMPVLR